MTVLINIWFDYYMDGFILNIVDYYSYWKLYCIEYYTVLKYLK